MLNINWEYIQQFDIKRVSFDELQFQMNHIYQAQLTESNRRNYLKMVNLLQMIIFYNEYCNFQIKETKSQLDFDIEKIDQQILEKEQKLLKSKRHYQKCKIYKEELKKQLKLKPKKVFGCLYCNNEFQNTIQLDRHMEIHKEPPNITPQILAIQKELQQQLIYLYQAKQQRKQLEFQKEDLKCGMLAAAERNQVLVSNDKINQIEKVYIYKVKQLESVLKHLDEYNDKFQYQNEWLDNLEEGIKESLNLKREQERLLQTQINIQQQSEVLKSQRSLQVSKKELRIPSNATFKPQSQLFIQSQFSGSNHQFRRSKDGMEYTSDDSPKEEIIIEEDDIIKEYIDHRKNKSSVSQNLKPKHSKNPSGVSFQESNIKGLTHFEQYEYRYQEFNGLVTEMLLNRYYLRRTQFDQNLIEKEKQKLIDQFDDLDQADDLEDLLKQLQKQTRGFEKRKRYQIKKKILYKQDQQENQAKENTITTLESSSEDEESRKDKDEDEELKNIQQQFELRKFPFEITGGEVENGNQQQQQQDLQQGYGVNTFSINY